MDLGNEMLPGCSMLHGDVRMAWNVKDCELIGDILESILAFCQLTTEWHCPAGGLKGMSYVRVQIAHQFGKLCKGGARTYRGCTVAGPQWMANFCPAALKKSNRNR